MLAHADRTDTRTAAAVRDAERLVQVQVRDVGTELAHPGQADQGVEVRAVDVDLAARIVHEAAHLAHGVLVHAVRGRVGDHDRGEVVGVFGDHLAQVCHVDVAGVVAAHHDHPHPGHHRTGGVGAVRARRDQAHVPVGGTPAVVVGLDRQQAGEFALAASVGLQAHGVVAGDLGKPGLQVLDDRQQPFGVLGGRERVQRTELGPGDRLHLGRRVELHRARAQRDHAAVQRDVLVGQLPQVAQQRGLGAVGVEHRVGEVFRGAGQRLRQRVRGLGVELVDVDARDAECLPHGRQVRPRGGLVAADADMVGVHPAEVDAAPAGRGDDVIGLARHLRDDGVEELPVQHLDPAAAQLLGEHCRHPVRAGRDRPKPGRAVVHRVHRRHDGQQHLRGADVAGGLLAADVLFAGLQRQPVGLVAVGIHAHPDQPARELPLKSLGHGHEPGVRTTEADRHAEALRAADHHVRTDLAGRTQQRQREQVGRDDDLRAAPVCLGDDFLLVAHRTGGARVGHQRAEELALRQRLRAWRQIGDDDLDAQRLRAGLDHRDGLRQRVGVHHEPGRLRPARPARQRHAFGRGGGLVEHRRVRHRCPGQVGHHRLEVQQRFEPALRDLRLVWGVRGVPGGALQHVAPDHRRRDRAVVAQPDHLGVRVAAARQRAQFGQRLRFGGRLGQRELQVAFPDGVRHGALSQLLQRADADHVEHVGQLGRHRPDVPVGERRTVLQGGQWDAVVGHVGHRQTSIIAANKGRQCSRGCSALPLCHCPRSERLRASPGARACTVGGMHHGRGAPSFQRYLARAVQVA